jgi:NAD(P)-dependent dehydrogenase (short-subunit alcohol dehydrogenase family)
MARIFVTGSSDGLGRAAARSLMSEGHEVVLHARSDERASTLADLAFRGAGVVIGDLRSAVDVRRIADQLNTIGRMDAVIHNADIYMAPNRGSTPEGHAVIVAVNTLAPFMLTALIECPDRLVYLSSGLHRGGEGSLRDLDWTKRAWDPARAYGESKLHVVALAFLRILRLVNPRHPRALARIPPTQLGLWSFTVAIAHGEWRTAIVSSCLGSGMRAARAGNKIATAPVGASSHFIPWDRKTCRLS